MAPGPRQAECIDERARDVAGRQFRPELTELFDLLGELDAAFAVEVFSANRQTCSPVLAETEALEVTGARHEGIHFDYRLSPGLAEPRNAVRLLESLGYPREVLAEAQAMLEPGGVPVRR